MAKVALHVVDGDCIQTRISDLPRRRVQVLYDAIRRFPGDGGDDPVDVVLVVARPGNCPRVLFRRVNRRLADQAMVLAEEPLFDGEEE